MAETKRREIRIDDELWDKAIRKSRREGTTVSKLVREFLIHYTSSDSAADELKWVIQRLNNIQHRVDTHNGNRCES